jgi:hypothetical protein
MAHDLLKSLDYALAQVKEGRRGFLKKLLVGSVVATVPLMSSEAVAEDDDAPRKGKKVAKTPPVKKIKKVKKDED